MIDQNKLAQLAAFVESCSFPCTKQELLERAENENATDEVVDMLDQIPDREYLSETDIIETAQGCVC